MVWYKINYQDGFDECSTYPLHINAAVCLGRGINFGYFVVRNSSD